MENTMFNETEKSVSVKVEEYTLSSKHCNKTLEKLIGSLKKGYSENSKTVKYLRDPLMLVEALEDINSVIGNNSVKEALARQIDDIIADKVRVAQDPKIKDRNTMANIMLYGPPGTGKTMLSNKIGKVMYSVGQLNDYKIEPTKSYDSQNQEFDFNISSTASTISSLILILIAILAIIKLIPVGYKLYVLTAILVIVFLIVMIWYTFFKDPTSNEKILFPKIKDEEKTENKEYVTHATRSHFVAEFVGHSAIKTRKFLQENLGKVIFLDEAYGLIQSYDDKFGNEAANEIVQFMTNYPRAIVFIFAGYKKDIERTLFKYQEGFKRRFKYRWNCPGYSAEELFEIFKYQVYSSGWKIKNDDISEIQDMIIENSNNFKAFAGDTEQVVDFAKIEHSHNFMHGNVEGYSLLTKNHVLKGIQEFKESIDMKNDEPEIKEKNLSDLFHSFNF